MELPFKFRKLSAEEQSWMRSCHQDNHKIVKGVKGCSLQTGDVILPERFIEAKIAHRICNMRVRPDDVWVITYPRSGTTWTVETVWSLINRIDPEQKDLDLRDRTFFLEYNCFDESWPDKIEAADHAKVRRIIKTHLPLRYLPPDLLHKSKVIYVSRDPRDVLVSNYYFARSDGSLKDGVGIEDYAKVFMSGSVAYGDVIQHVREHQKFRDHPNFMWLTYEDMKADFIGSLNLLERFLEVEITDEIREEIIKRTDINSMRNRAVKKEKSADKKEFMKGFYRKGVSQSFVYEFKDPEIIQSVQDWARSIIETKDNH